MRVYVPKLIVQVEQTVEAFFHSGDGTVTGQNKVIKLQVRRRALEVGQFGFFNESHGTLLDKFNAALASPVPSEDVSQLSINMFSSVAC